MSLRFGLDDECLESFCKAEGRANELRLDRCSAALYTCRVAHRLLQTSMQSPRCRLVAGLSKGHHHQQQHYSAQKFSTRSALWIFLPPSYSLDGRFEGPTPFIGQLASAPRCAATSLLLRSCTVVLTIKRWDAPRPVSLTRGFKGHTPFIRPVFATASAASCLCHQVRLGLLRISIPVAADDTPRHRSEMTFLGPFLPF